MQLERACCCSLSAHLMEAGTRSLRWSYVWSLLAAGGTHPRRLVMRHTCVSTGNCTPLQSFQYRT